MIPHSSRILCRSPAWRIWYWWLGHLRRRSYDAALHAGVIEASRLAAVRPELEALRPLPAVFDQQYVRVSGAARESRQDEYDWPSS